MLISDCYMLSRSAKESQHGHVYAKLT